MARKVEDGVYRSSGLVNGERFLMRSDGGGRWTVRFSDPRKPGGDTRVVLDGVPAGPVSGVEAGARAAIVAEVLSGGGRRTEKSVRAILRGTLPLALCRRLAAARVRELVLQDRVADAAGWLVHPFEAVACGGVAGQLGQVLNGVRKVEEVTGESFLAFLIARPVLLDRLTDGVPTARVPAGLEPLVFDVGARSLLAADCGGQLSLLPVS
ncbi:hypothetical protein [Azospirillum sp. TSO5]|uniref:hypothetical protein n=1 Tax=Azospirillum sp. TSO5 TaxID=716760 RepID=UPI000D60C764|nr:hypothetical protein [Azospirillum sp. TSO5]PWC92659.1 hypothetical protein TSO5_17220 [Azospirillum sp. TSO5]